MFLVFIGKQSILTNILLKKRTKNQGLHCGMRVEEIVNFSHFFFLPEKILQIEYYLPINSFLAETVMPNFDHFEQFARAQSCTVLRQEDKFLGQVSKVDKSKLGRKITTAS
jgi:hypothetical protein